MLPQVSQEFMTAVQSGNLLRTRIMLKDSLIVDPTFKQFEKMYLYAKNKLPDLFIPHDGEALEEDTTKWNTDLMNTELVEIINNFSEVRIEHLKKVIPVVMADNIRKAPMTTDQRRSQVQQVTGPTQRTTHYSSMSDIRGQKAAERKQALRDIAKYSEKIERVMRCIRTEGKYTLSDIQKLEDAAKQIVSAAEKYKNNR